MQSPLASVVLVAFGMLMSSFIFPFQLDDAFAEPTVTIITNDCSRYPEFLEVFYRVSGFPPGIGAIVLREIGDEVRLVGGGLPFTDSNGEGGGGFTTSADAPGPYTITVYEDNDPRDGVADAGGAQASTSFTCEVIPPQQAVQELIDTIDNMDLSRGTTVSLEATLNAAVRQLDRNNDEAACSQLDAFLNKVDVRENNGRLTSQQATDLRQQATAIQEALGCTTSPPSSSSPQSQKHQQQSPDTNLPSALSISP